MRAVWAPHMMETLSLLVYRVGRQDLSGNGYIAAFQIQNFNTISVFIREQALSDIVMHLVLGISRWDSISC